MAGAPIDLRISLHPLTGIFGLNQGRQLLLALWHARHSANECGRSASVRRLTAANDRSPTLLPGELRNDEVNWYQQKAASCVSLGELVSFWKLRDILP